MSWVRFGHNRGMYISKLDEAECFLVSVFCGKNTPEDFERFIACWERLDQLGSSRADGVALHIVVFHDSERPDATQRRRFADLRRRARTARPIGALVSESALMRGLLRVIQWIAPPPAHFRLGVFETFDECARWAEGLMGRGLPTIRGSYQEAIVEAQRLG